MCRQDQQQQQDQPQCKPTAAATKCSPSSSSSCQEEEESNSKEEAANSSGSSQSLSRLEIWNLTFALLAWACTISNVTLVVGTSAVVILSIGGDDSIASVPLGAFMVGSSLISLTVTPWLFRLWGRQKGFLLGIALGLLGTSLGCLAVALEWPILLIVASVFFGTATGIGFFWRFAAVETVPSEWAARAVTLVVSGGCLAAFAGPESARGTRHQFGNPHEDPHLEYIGVYVMTGVFNVLNLLFTVMVQFPRNNNNDKNNTVQQQQQEEDTEAATEPEESTIPTLGSLLKTRHFLIPMFIAGLSWAIMTLPMSMVTVVMTQVGFSNRQSLLVIELHFLGMYAPGFITGNLLQRYGPPKVCAAAAVIFAVAMACTIAAQEAEDGNASMALWTAGMVLIGVGWNWGFTGATVWLTRLYRQAPQHKEKVQAANDSCMFLIAGAWIVSASYIFEAGGSGLEGWRLLNKVVVGLLALYIVVLLVHVFLQSQWNTR